MKKLLATSAVASAFALATPASAQQFDGATLFYQHYSQDGGDYYMGVAGAQIAGSFNQFGLQLDLGGFWWEGDATLDFPTYGIHAYYEVNDNLTAGVYLGAVVWDRDDPSENEIYYGIEALYETGPWTIQGHYILQDYANDGAGPAFGLDVDYSFGSVGFFDDVAVFVDLRTVDPNWDPLQKSAALGVRGALDNGAFAEFQVHGSYDDDGDLNGRGVALKIGYELGNGTKFTRHDYSKQWQGY